MDAKIMDDKPIHPHEEQALRTAKKIENFIKNHHGIEVTSENALFDIGEECDGHKINNEVQEIEALLWEMAKKSKGNPLKVHYDSDTTQS